MKIIRTKDYQDMSRKAAKSYLCPGYYEAGLRIRLATRLYAYREHTQQLGGMVKNGDLDFVTVKSVNLDEYKGLPRTNDQSYYYFMYNNLFKDINIDMANTNVPDGTEPDSEKECARYEAVVESMGGVDLQRSWAWATTAISALMSRLTSSPRQLTALTWLQAPSRQIAVLCKH